MSAGGSTVADMVIDCDTCTVRGDGCEDCVVTFLTIPVRGARLDLDEAEQAAIDVLADCGLVPPLRMAPAS